MCLSLNYAKNNQADILLKMWLLSGPQISHVPVLFNTLFQNRGHYNDITTHTPSDRILLLLSPSLETINQQIDIRYHVL